MFRNIRSHKKPKHDVFSASKFWSLLQWRYNFSGAKTLLFKLWLLCAKPKRDSLFSKYCSIWETKNRRNVYQDGGRKFFHWLLNQRFLKIVATLKCRNVVGKPPAVFSTNGFCQLTRCNISSTLSGIKTSRTVRQHCPSSLYRVAKVTRHFNKKCIFTKMYQNTIPGMYSHNFRWSASKIHLRKFGFGHFSRNILVVSFGLS